METELRIRVDTAQPAQAVTQLDKLASSAARAEVAERGLASASSAASATLQSSANLTARLASEQVRQANSMGAAALSAKQYSQAMRLLPAQITDVVTSLASGSPAYLVAIQQGGQLRDSFGGIGATFKALATILTPARLAFGGAAAAAAILAKGFADGQRESFELQKSIVLSGNAAGVTAGQLGLMSRAIAEVVGTRADASAALAAAVSTGQISANALEGVVKVALRLQETAGKPLKETIAQFAALGDRPVEAAEKLQKQYAFLTVSVYDQILALDKEHKGAEAAKLGKRVAVTPDAPRA